MQREPPPLRFLLDQGFPNPPAGVEPTLFIRTVEYQHFNDFAPDLARVSTPDWMLYLAAKVGGFDAVVTRDLAQFGQREELVCLKLTGLTMVTWRQPIEDPLAEWGQMIAYGPQIARRMQARGYSPSVFFLPAPRLGADQMRGIFGLAHEMAAGDGVSYPEWQTQALQVMRDALGRSRQPRAQQVRRLLDGLVG